MNSGRRQQLRADLVLLAVAVIWGSAFVAQRQGMEKVGPFAFNATRFAIGALALVVFMGWRRLRNTSSVELWQGALLGILLFGGASLQQVGLVYTTAGKAGFITGLYVVIVPLLLALVWRERVGLWSWVNVDRLAGRRLCLDVGRHVGSSGACLTFPRVSRKIYSFYQFGMPVAKSPAYVVLGKEVVFWERFWRCGLPGRVER